MKYITMNHIKPGMIAGKDILDSNNRLLFRKGNLISDFAINKLKESGYEGLYVETELTKGIEFDELIPESLKNKIADDFKKINIEGTVNNAKSVVDKILSAKNISLEYTDIRNKDNYLYNHSIAVAEFSTVIGVSLGLTQDELVELATAAILHDLGKLCVNKGVMKTMGIVLSKETAAYDKEMHPIYGRNLLEGNYYVTARTKIGILQHHINEDRTGFPIMKEGIPLHLFAKIIHVADAYDNKRHDDPAEAFEYLMGGCDTLFNKDVVDKFVKYIPAYPLGTTVILSNGLIGMVIRQNKSQPLRPVIRLLTKEQQELDLKENYLNITIIGIDKSEELIETKIR